MSSYFQKVKDYLLDLEYYISYENEDDQVFVVNDEVSCIKNLVIGCADPILIMEQFVFELTEENSQVYRGLLQKNRNIVHGAFVLDESGLKVIYRDTLQIENLDKNELAASINSLSLLLSEYSEELLDYAKN